MPQRDRTRQSEDAGSGLLRLTYPSGTQKFITLEKYTELPDHAVWGTLVAAATPEEVERHLENGGKVG